MEVLLFEIGDKRFGVKVINVREVVRAVKLSPLAQASEMIEALLNLRGLVLPVVNVRRLFALESRKLRHTDYFIVVATQERTLALHVDIAIDLVDLATEDVQLASSVLSQTGLVECVATTEDGLVHVIDVERLVALDDAGHVFVLTDSQAKGPSA